VRLGAEVVGFVRAGRSDHPGDLGAVGRVPAVETRAGTGIMGSLQR